MTEIPLLTKCLYCDTPNDDFYEEWHNDGNCIYECPNCGETYDGEELSEVSA